MSNSRATRRHFLRTTTSVLGSALVVNLPLIQACAAQARVSFQAGEDFKALTAKEAVELAALAAQIFPTDGTPGAREAGVIHFIDQALNSFASSLLVDIRDALPRFHTLVKAMCPTDGSFSNLPFERQTELLRELEALVEEEEENGRSQELRLENGVSQEEKVWAFFEIVRTLTVMGMFANSFYGGNQNEIGWKILGFEDAHVFEPPFGFYDAEYTELAVTDEADKREEEKRR